MDPGKYKARLIICSIEESIDENDCFFLVVC